jgi:hypothetical protein
MSAIRLYSESGQWKVEHEGQTRKALLVSVDSNETFRSFGLHPQGAVAISVHPSGEIADVTLLDHTPVSELFVPPGHSLYRDITLG